MGGPVSVKISYEWLGEYVDTTGLTPAAAAEMLTMTGTKVESIEATDLSAIIVGRVLEQRPHPASRNPLWIHQVDIGGEVRQIIAGAPNAGPGSLVPVALPGTVVPGGKEVRDARIAGEEGRGMLCSAAELNLSDDHAGILVLDRGEPGQSLAELYPIEAVFDCEITPNRPDCLGHIGVARELAAAAGREMRVDFMPSFVAGGPPDRVAVTIEEPSLCRRYIGVVVRGARIEPSPEWMQRRLRAAGVRPINNAVDVTAYVMLEYGQPLHVFDLARLAGPEIRVRRARDGETLLCLDGQMRKLTPAMLVIADAERPVAVGGVIGGQESGVTGSSRDLLLESAAFDGINVRATSRALALRTEASLRNEKHLSSELALAGARRAAELLAEITGGTVSAEWADEYPAPQEPVRVTLEPWRIEALMGTPIGADESRATLRRLGFHVRDEDGRWDVFPPVFRLDIELPEDVIEEVGRIHGVDRVAPTLPGRRRDSWVAMDTDRPLDLVAETLLGAGFDEAVTSALVSGRRQQRLGLEGAFASLANPMSEELDTMRVSLLPSLLQATVLNRHRGRAQVRFFEIGRVYLADPSADGLAAEPTRISALATDFDFASMKSVLDRILAEVGAAAPTYVRATAQLFHPGRSAALMIGPRRVGTVGELHPTVLAGFDLTGRAVGFEVDAAALLSDRREKATASLPRFPGIERDLAVSVAEELPAAILLDTIAQSAGDLLAALTAYDEYRSEAIGAGRRSITFALTFRSADRTLTDSEVDETMESIRRRLEADHGARGR